MEYILFLTSDILFCKPEVFMNVSYFPGCTLKTKAKELDVYARRCAEVLGVTLEEIENWQCCGGVFSTAKDEIADMEDGLEKTAKEAGLKILEEAVKAAQKAAEAEIGQSGEMFWIGTEQAIKDAK